MQLKPERVHRSIPDAETSPTLSPSASGIAELRDVGESKSPTPSNFGGQVLDPD